MGNGEMWQAPRLQEQSALKTKLTDLFKETAADETTSKTNLSRARRILATYCDSKIHAKLKDRDYVPEPDPELTVGNVLNFKLVRGRRGHWFSQHKASGRSQKIDGMGDGTFEIIKQRLQRIGVEMDHETSPSFKPLYYWTP